MKHNKYKVWVHDWNGDEPYLVEAIDEEHAAIQVAEEGDEEYHLIDNPVEIHVCEEDSEVLTKFSVYAEASVRYYANEVD